MRTYMSLYKMDGPLKFVAAFAAGYFDWYLLFFFLPWRQRKVDMMDLFDRGKP
jgi:hypothetical protein